MKIKIVEEKHNPFLKRKEILVRIDHDGEATPSMQALGAFIAKDMNADPEKLEVLNIYSARGAATAKSQVHIWDEKKPVKKAKEKIAEKKEKEEVKKKETVEKKEARKEKSEKEKTTPTIEEKIGKGEKKDKG